jgi:hypothetical protein
MSFQKSFVYLQHDETLNNIIFIIGHLSINT